MSTNQEALDNLAEFISGAEVKWKSSRHSSAPRRRGTVEGSALMQTGSPSKVMTLDLIVRVKWEDGDSELCYAKYLEVV